MLRGLALFGVLVVNIGLFSGSDLALDAKVAYPAGWGGAWPASLRTALVESKAAALLAMLFGAGLVMQWEKASKRSDAVRFALRRAGALALLGIAHSFLLWNADILLDYALISLLVMPFLDVRPSRVLWAIPALLPVTALLVLPVVRLPFPEPDRVWATSLAHYGSGSWLEALRFRSWEMLHVMGPQRLANRIPILTPFFVLGVWFWKKGWFSEPARHRPALRRLFFVAFGLGLIANLLPQESLFQALGQIPFRPLRVLTKAICFIARPGLTLGYASGVLLLLESARWRPWLGIFAPLGRTTLTQYLLQSVVCTWIFNGYGLGLYGKVPINACIVGSIAFFALQVWSSRAWLARHRTGPVEWLWRRMAYGSGRVAPARVPRNI